MVNEAMVERPERRTSMLSDGDIERIETAFDKRLNALFEMIGYDTSTHESRSNIRQDHEFVRDARKAKGKIITTFFTSMAASAALWLWNAFGGKSP